jgi:DivIVA domain-containing protein
VAGLVFVVGLLVVGGLLFLGGSVLLGRGETQPPAEVGRSPVELPDDRPVVGDDIRALRISVAFRGYRMTEVDWLVDQFAQVLDERDTEIAELRAAAGPGPVGRHAAEPVRPPATAGDPHAGDPHAGDTDAGDTDPDGRSVPVADEEGRGSA